jgi:hypothetical protein
MKNIRLSSISQKYTGLDVIVFVETCGEQIPIIRFQDNVSAKVQMDDLVSVSISDNPELLDCDIDSIGISSVQIYSVKDWIVNNKSILLDYWYGLITTDILFERLNRYDG